MKRVAILVLAMAWTAMAGNALAQARPHHGGGERMERRQEQRQPQPQPQQPHPQPQPQPQGPSGDQGRRMSQQERQELRDQIRQHGSMYRDRRP